MEDGRLSWDFFADVLNRAVSFVQTNIARPWHKTNFTFLNHFLRFLSKNCSEIIYSGYVTHRCPHICNSSSHYPEISLHAWWDKKRRKVYIFPSVHHACNDISLDPIWPWVKQCYLFLRPEAAPSVGAGHTGRPAGASSPQVGWRGTSAGLALIHQPAWCFPASIYDTWTIGRQLKLCQRASLWEAFAWRTQRSCCRKIPLKEKAKASRWQE